MDNPYQAPAHAEVVVDRLGRDLPGEPPYASRWARLAAALIDGLLAISLSLGFTIGVLGKQLFSSPPPDFSVGEQVLTNLIGMACFLLLHGVLLHRRGQTIGKWLLGIRITDLQGGHVPFTRILVRRVMPIWAVAWIPYVGPFLCVVDDLFIFNRQRMCIHDLIAGTIVVKVPRLGSLSAVDQLPA